uniref:Uncharacterized protein n=1 Tax=Acrobeloides nanus TaxID=290746 RepID=A0A914C919_9BILA
MNTVQAMIDLLFGMELLKIEFEDTELKLDAKNVRELAHAREEFEPLTPELTRTLIKLWKDPSLRIKTYDRGNEFQLPECASHFLNSLERIAKPEYEPTEQDILLVRKQTTGIVQMNFKIKNYDFRVFDVGGQRSERKKWIHCFEDVHAIIFIIAISEFDQVLLEDDTTNRMLESMRLFATTCNSCWFINTSIILFLNKKDLFEEKIKKKTIKICFPDYFGTNSYDEQIQFFERKFEKLNANPDKTIYIHQTCATDTNQVQLILDNVLEMIIEANLQGLGIT